MTAVLLIVGLLLVLACAIFVAAEFSLLTVDRAKVEEAAQNGDRRATSVLSALKSLSTQLSGAQLGITITNLAIGLLVQPAIGGLLEQPLKTLGLPPGATPAIALTLGLLIATGVTMLLGELVPKNLAISEPWRTARLVAGPQRLFTKSMSKAVRLLNGTANATVRTLGIEPTEELASARTAEELTALVAYSAEKGTLDTDTANLIARSLAFGNRTARDVRTPRTQVHVIPANATVNDIINASRTTGHSRFPITQADGLDTVTGIAHLKHALAVPRDQRDHTSAQSVSQTPLVVPDSIALDPLLDQLRAEGLQMAIVLDEYGGASGIVTLEDLIEEIIGDVTDEHDQPTSRARQNPDGTWTVSALLRPDEAHELTGLRLPSDPGYETLAGLLAETLHRVPALNDNITVSNVQLTVTRMDGRRIDQITLQAAPEEPA